MESKEERMKKLKALCIGCAVALSSHCVNAGDWRFTGTYTDSRNRDYMSFYDASSAMHRGHNEFVALVRTVWVADINSYWRRHGGDSDIVDSATERAINGNLPEFYGLASVVQQTQPGKLHDYSIVAMGNEFMVNSERVPVRQDVLWLIDCKRHLFSSAILIFKKAAKKSSDAQKSEDLKYKKISAETEPDYLQQMLCKRIA
jgi:hypothetical protein